MGNSGSVEGNIDGVWNHEGADVTIGGIRIGGGKTGIEVGPNIGISAEIDGKGSHTEGQAKLTVEGQGASTGGAKAPATAGIESVGATAHTGTSYDGTSYARSASQTNANVRQAKDKYNNTKN